MLYSITEHTSKYIWLELCIPDKLRHYLDELLDSLDKSFEFDLLSCAGAGLSRIFRDPTTNWTEREKGFNFAQKALLTW